MSGRFSTAPLTYAGYGLTRHGRRVVRFWAQVTGRGCLSFMHIPRAHAQGHSVKSRGRGRSKVLIGATVRVVE